MREDRNLNVDLVVNVHANLSRLLWYEWRTKTKVITSNNMFVYNDPDEFSPRYVTVSWNVFWEPGNKWKSLIVKRVKIENPAMYSAKDHKTEDLFIRYEENWKILLWIAQTKKVNGDANLLIICMRPLLKYLCCSLHVEEDSWNHFGVTVWIITNMTHYAIWMYLNLESTMKTSFQCRPVFHELLP